MLFRKKIEPRCSYCARGGRANDHEVICAKKGIVPAESTAVRPLRSPEAGAAPSGEAGDGGAAAGGFPIIRESPEAMLPGFLHESQTIS